MMAHLTKAVEICESGVEIAGKRVKRVELLCENYTPTH